MHICALKALPWWQSRGLLTWVHFPGKDGEQVSSCVSPHVEWEQKCPLLKGLLSLKFIVGRLADPTHQGLQLDREKLTNRTKLSKQAP